MHDVSEPDTKSINDTNQKIPKKCKRTDDEIQNNIIQFLEKASPEKEPPARPNPDPNFFCNWTNYKVNKVHDDVEGNCKRFPPAFDGIERKTGNVMIEFKEPQLA